LLKKVFDRNKLLFLGQTASLADPVAFKGILNAPRKKRWIAYAKKPLGSPEHVLDYLGRYTHRVALSDDRILSAHNGKVTFSYRDRKNENRKKTMPLNAHEFSRRFLLHVILVRSESCLTALSSEKKARLTGSPSIEITQLSPPAATVDVTS
jgi:hypothetical protein